MTAADGVAGAGRAPPTKLGVMVPLVPELSVSGSEASTTTGAEGAGGRCLLPDGSNSPASANNLWPASAEAVTPRAGPV